MDKLTVGAKVFYTGDMANPSGLGAVCAVTPIASPLKSYTLGTGRMIPVDNSVRYDVVLNDGRLLKALPTFLFDPTAIGLRFKLRDGVATADELAAMLAFAGEYAAKKVADAATKAFEFGVAKAAAKDAGLKIGLVPEADFKGRGTAAAFNMRRELKAAGVKVASLRGDYSSINARVAPDDYEAAEKISRKYKAGHFDGMTDCYEFDPCAWGAVFGDVRFVFIEKERALAKEVA